MIRRVLFERFGTLLVVLCAVQLVVVFLMPPGCLIIDEVTYHAMTRALARSASLAIDNGWDVARSPELEWEHARAVGGRLVGQYPEGFPLLVAPLYRVLGVRAFFVVSTIAFYATVHVCRSLAFALFGKRSLAVASALVFALATYSWEYSLGIWPHATTLFLGTAAVHQSFVAAERASLGRQLAAGALVGVATTMRLDAVFTMTAVVLMPAIVPSRVRGVVAAAVGALGAAPAVAFLAVTNHAKFGSWQPFSYGPWHAAGSNTGLFTYAPLAAIGVLVVAAAYAIDPAKIRLRHVAIATGLALVAVLVVRPLRTAASDCFTILVDLRNYDPNADSPALSHSPRGAMIYVGALKKSFLQSLPWLPLAVAAPFMRGAPRRRLVAIAVPFVASAGVFAALGWHGGLCVNLRYLLPAAPYAAIAATYTSYRLLRRVPPLIRRLRDLDAILLSIVAGWFVVVLVGVFPSAIGVREVFFLDLPLALAALLAGALVAKRASVAIALGALAFVWAGMTELTYDAVATVRARGANYAVAARVRSVAEPGAFVFAEYPDLVSGALEDDVVVAQPSRDGYADVARLAALASARGKPSFVVLSGRSLDTLRARADITTSEPIATERGYEIRRVESR